MQGEAWDGRVGFPKRREVGAVECQRARTIDANVPEDDGLGNTCHFLQTSPALRLDATSPPTIMSSSTLQPAEPPTTLRQRRVEDRTSLSSLATGGAEPDALKRDEVVWGKTPSGEGTWLHSCSSTGRESATQCLGGARLYIGLPEPTYLRRDMYANAASVPPTV